MLQFEVKLNLICWCWIHEIIRRYEDGRDLIASNP